MPALHCFSAPGREFWVDNTSAPVAVMVAEAEFADLGPGKFTMVSSGSYVWQGACAPRRASEALRTSQLSWDRETKTLSGSGSALARSARYESLRVSSSHTGKLVEFAWSHDECDASGEVLAWVYRDGRGMTLRVVND